MPGLVSLRIVSTTDGKFVGNVIMFDGLSVVINGFNYTLPEEIQSLGAGMWRFANSNYQADCIEIEE
jgi:hypothetical protein